MGKTIHMLFTHFKFIERSMRCLAMLNIKDLRSEPFLWIHLLGIAMFPIFVGVTIVGLGIGNSYSFVLELPLLISTAVLPIFLMQLKRPFDIFSVLFLALKPECLSDRQRAILSLFKTFKHQLFSAIAAIAMIMLLWLLYSLSPLATDLVSFLPQQRILGLGIAAIGFFACNLFFQIPLSVLLVLLTEQVKLTQIQPYSLDEIQRDFTIVGLKITNILWFLESETKSL